MTHFDENGCLDIREFDNDNDTSGQETSDMEVLKSDQVTEIGPVSLS